MSHLIGIDPGLNTTGFAVITNEDLPRILRVSTIKTPAKYPRPARLMAIYQRLGSALQPYFDTVAFVGIESALVGRGGAATIALAEAAGVIKLLLAAYKLPMRECHPTNIKREIAGKGNASKLEVADAVGDALFINTAKLKSHETDALAIALLLRKELERKPV